MCQLRAGGKGEAKICFSPVSLCQLRAGGKGEAKIWFSSVSYPQITEHRNNHHYSCSFGAGI